MGIVCLLSLSACVTFDGEAPNPESAHIDLGRTDSQKELHALAKDLADTPWPTISRPTMTQMILGGPEKSQPIDPVAAYLEILQQDYSSVEFESDATSFKASSLTAMVMQDAYRQLDVANAINTMAREAATSSRLSSNDITIVEQSILALRKNRAVFIETLKKLSENGERVPATQISKLKTSFVNAGRVLGKTANIMSDQLAGVFVPEQTAPIASDTASAPTTIFQSDFTNFQ